MIIYGACNSKHAYGEFIRYRLARYHKIKTTIQDKDTRRKLLDDVKGEIKDVRRSLHNVGRFNDCVTMLTSNDGDSWVHIYTEPFEFEGTKQDFIKSLWENHATRVCSPFDCTGKPFTTDYKVGYIGDNLWKVAEYMSLDI